MSKSLHKTQSDYYPFGMMLPNTSDEPEDNDYRYGFNGMEKDDEVSGDANSYDFGARLYNPRVGRWLSRAPLERKYANISPYVGLGNNPISFKDPDGRDIIPVVVEENSSVMVGHMAIAVTIYKEIIIMVQDENGGEPVPKSYYEAIGVKLYETDGRTNEDESNTSAQMATPEMLDAGVVQYTLNPDGIGILGSDISSELDPEKRYFTAEETQAERSASEFGDGMIKGVAKGKAYSYLYYQDIVDGEYVANDCSTLVVDMLNATGLVEKGFGLATTTPDENGTTYSTPTPNTIALDLEKMDLEKRINQEGAYKYILEIGAEKSQDLLDKEAKTIID